MATATSRLSNFDATVFTSKAAVSAVLAVVVLPWFGVQGVVWAAISAVIVTEPALQSSLHTSFLRVIANIIGAITGAIVSSFLGHSPLSLAVGVIVTGLICHFTRLDDALRPAYTAVVIIILTSENGAWAGSRDRVVAEVLGCVCALIVGLVFDKTVAFIKARQKPDAPPESPSI